MSSGLAQYALVQCTTGPLAIAGGGTFDDIEGLVAGIREVGWPNIEMRLWDRWQPAHYAGYLEKVLATGVIARTVHAPPRTEDLLSGRTPDEAIEVFDGCVAAARMAGSRAIVFHAWDLRKASFDPRSLVSNLQAVHERYAGEGLALCLEALPGYSTLLPLLEKECPYLQFVADTQWAAVEGDWRPLLDRTPRVTGLHVQTFVDVSGEGEMVLGRGRFGAACDVRSVIREMRARGFSGEVTLEPLGVTSDRSPLRQALRYLAALVSS